MDVCSDKKPLIVIAGPTASGKTETAIAVAKELRGEIISADSMQLYRTLDIGTAKPDKSELAAVPHHLIDIRSPEELYSVADFVSDAREAAQRIEAKGKLPIICGGTGLYISSFINGIEFQGEKTDDAIRQELLLEYEKVGIEPFLKEIAEKDEEYASTLHPNNVKRILRAVERLRATKLTDSEQNERSRRTPSEYNVFLFVLCPPRELLYERIEKRIDAMLERGLLDEARRVYENRESYKTAAQAIGYKELFGYFEKTASLEECVAILKQQSRRYAKRQITWFKREKSAVWLDSSLGSKTTAEQIVARLQGSL